MRTAAALVLLLAAAACGKAGTDWRILQLYSGETSVELLRRPAKVQAFRVEAAPRAPGPDEAHAGPFIAAAAPIDVPADAAAALSAVFVDADSYGWRDRPRPCRPQVGLLFVRGPYVLELALDLDAGQVRVFAGDQPLGAQGIDAAALPRLVEIAKRLFPGDAAVRALK